MTRFNLLCGLALLLCCFALPALAAAPKIFLDLKADNQVVVERDGKEKRVPPEGFGAQPINNSKLLYTAFGEEDAKEYGLTAGIYIFDESGKLTASAPSEAAEMSAEAVLSPGGTVLAMDAGGSLNRDWFFFSFPSMKPIGQSSVGYFMAEGKPTLLWNGETDVLFNTMDTESKRECEYDPCGPVSVTRHNLATGKTTAILQGTMLCDYTLLSFAGGVVTADKLCLKTAKDWKAYPEDTVPREKVTAKLP